MDAPTIVGSVALGITVLGLFATFVWKMSSLDSLVKELLHRVVRIEMHLMPPSGGSDGEDS